MERIPEAEAIAGEHIHVMVLTVAYDGRERGSTDDLAEVITAVLEEDETFEGVRIRFDLDPAGL
jgi:hypothetical protein